MAAQMHPQPSQPGRTGGSLTLELAFRFCWSRRASLSAVSLAAVAGLALSISVLIVVISVINGFERELKERVLAVVPHVSVYQRNGMRHEPQIVQDFVTQPAVDSAAAYVQEAALVSAGGKVAGVVVQGIEPSAYHSVTDVLRYVSADADLTSRGYGVYLGRRLADDLDLQAGDSLRLIVPTATVSPVGLLPRQRRFTVLGIVDTQTEMDARSAYVHISDAQRLFRLGSKVSGYHLKLADLFDLTAAFDAVDQVFLNGGVVVRPWTRVHGPLLQAIVTQKLTMFVLLSFLVGVAAFNLVSGLVMVVDQRATDVAVLRTMGATTRQVVAVFACVGIVLGVVGVALGVLFGQGIASLLPGIYAWATSTFGLDLMNQYFIDYLPVQVLFSDVAMIVLVAVVLVFIATLFPCLACHTRTTRCGTCP